MIGNDLSCYYMYNKATVELITSSNQLPWHYFILKDYLCAWLNIIYSREGPSPP